MIDLQIFESSFGVYLYPKMGLRFSLKYGLPILPLPLHFQY